MFGFKVHSTGPVFNVVKFISIVNVILPMNQ